MVIETAEDEANRQQAAKLVWVSRLTISSAKEHGLAASSFDEGWHARDKEISDLKLELGWATIADEQNAENLRRLRGILALYGDRCKQTVENFTEDEKVFLANLSVILKGKCEE